MYSLCTVAGCEIYTNVTQKKTFSCTANGETFEINLKLNCLIYLLKCKICEK